MIDKLHDMYQERQDILARIDKLKQDQVQLETYIKRELIDHDMTDALDINWSRLRRTCGIGMR